MSLETGMSLGSSSDQREIKGVFLIRAPDMRNLLSFYFLCWGDVYNQIAII